MNTNTEQQSIKPKPIRTILIQHILPTTGIKGIPRSLKLLEEIQVKKGEWSKVLAEKILHQITSLVKIDGLDRQIEIKNGDNITVYARVYRDSHHQPQTYYGAASQGLKGSQLRHFIPS